MEIKEMEKRLSFVLKERKGQYNAMPPRGCSGIFATKGHCMVLCGSTLFLDGKKMEDDVIYISKDLDRIVASKDNEILVFHFGESVVRRIGVDAGIKRCDVWMEYLGVLFDDGRLKVFKDKRCVLSRENVKDFVLPDFIVESDGSYMSRKDVEKIFRCGSDKDDVIAITNEQLILEPSVTENPLHRGDFEYDKDIPPCYYLCDFCGIKLLASSNSSKFLLLGKELQELELEEEIKLLGLRTDEEFNTKYLTGMDYSDGVVYLIDEEGVVSRFEVCGIGEEVEREERKDIEFREKRYAISGDIISEAKEGNGLSKPKDEASMIEEKHPSGEQDKELKSSLSSLNNLLEVAQKHDTSLKTEQSRMDEQSSATGSEGKKTGDSRIDVLLESISMQADNIIEDFKKINVEKKVFQIYKHNSNDLSLFTEQTYKNIMRLDNCKSMKDEIIAQLTFMLGSLETYKGMSEENIKSTVKYIDTAIGRASDQRRRAVHYTKPLFYDVRKARSVGIRLDREKMEARKTLVNIEHVEKELNRHDMDAGLLRLEIKGDSGMDGLVDSQIPKEQDKSMDRLPVDEAPSVSKPVEVANAEDDLRSSRTLDAEMAEYKEESPNVGDISISSFDSGKQLMNQPDANSSLGSQTNIFGQPIFQQQPVQFGGLFQSSTPSNIFQSIASSSATLPSAPPKEEGESDQSTPNAFSRFANSRSLFK